jgi:predicted ATPase/transcriptional regulator with XRE-family HTH domain
MPSGESGTFGALLRRYRQAASLSQEVLAERAGLSAVAISALERGARRAPHLRTVEVLATALTLDVAERAALVAAARPEHATDPVAADDLVPSAGSLRELAFEQAARGPQSAGPNSNGRAARVRLPVPPTALIGREAAVATASALLDPARSSVRLLTLTGPGGVGKTRLALAVAAALADTYPDGVVFVDLSPLRDQRLLLATIARAMEMHEAGGRNARDLLLNSLRERQVLLVLDNFEHLLSAAPLLTELLQGCPRLALLVTSRAALRVRYEQRCPVPPLATPADEVSPMELAAAPAVRLFVDRAQAAAPEFGLDAGNAYTVSAICRRLDGLPLAIELAASRTGLLRPEALLRRLDQRLPLLTGGAADLPERQHTLRQTLAWSHELLGRGEQVLFRRLAVFAGGWPLEAAEAVCADAAPQADEVLERLQVLVDSSLVRQDDAEGERRFSILETVREYAREQLEAAGEAALIEHRHLAWFLGLVESVRPLEPSAEQIDRLALDLDNLRAALRCGIRTGQVELALRLGVGLYPLWYTRGLYTEGCAWLAELLALPGAGVATALRAQALAWAGHLASVQGRLAEAEGLVREGLVTAQQVRDELAESTCWQILGSLARRRGALSEADGLYRRSLASARVAANPVQEAWAAYLIAQVRYEQGDPDAVRTALTEAVLCSAVDTYPRVGARILGLKAWLAAADGDAASALAFEAQSLALFGRLGDQQGLASGCLEAAWRALDRGDLPKAGRCLAETLTIGRATGDQRAIAQGLEATAHLTSSVEPDRAAWLLEAAGLVRTMHGLGRTPLDQAQFERWAAGNLHQSREAARATAWEDRPSELLRHAIALALDVAAAAATYASASNAQF